VAFARYQQVEWVAIELRDGAHTPQEVSTPRTDWMGAVAIVPHRPLTPGERYTARRGDRGWPARDEVLDFHGQPVS